MIKNLEQLTFSSIFSTVDFDFFLFIIIFLSVARCFFLKKSPNDAENRGILAIYQKFDRRHTYGIWIICHILINFPSHLKKNMLKSEILTRKVELWLFSLMKLPQNNSSHQNFSVENINWNQKWSITK